MKWNISKRNGNPVNNYDSFRREMQNLFDDFFSIRPAAMFENKWVPSVDVEEDENAIHVRAEVPGIDEKDLTVTLENNVLTIAGEKIEEKKEENKDKRYMVSERRFGSFRRSLALPAGIRTDTIKAVFRNGVLKIEIPREESARPKMIKIDVK